MLKRRPPAGMEWGRFFLCLLLLGCAYGYFFWDVRRTCFTEVLR